jgi:hypothetical protein
LDNGFRCVPAFDRAVTGDRDYPGAAGNFHPTTFFSYSKTDFWIDNILSVCYYGIPLEAISRVKNEKIFL